MSDALAFLDAANVHAMLVDRIDAGRSGGMAAGLVDAHGGRAVAHGKLAKGDSRQVDGDTVFEIGSITKVFTSLLLADMVERGEVELTDPVSKHLPEGVGTPRRGEREITLFDLATHTSGLPRTDPKYGPLDNSKAYAEYTIDELYRFLGGYELTRDIGERYEYSNIGFGLLGHALALAAGLSFEELLRERITGPLGMTSTAVTPTPSMQPRLASGHDAALEPVPRFELSVLAGAGALLSTANDLVKFISAEIGFTHTPLAPAMTAQLAPRLPMNPRGSQTALGWHVTATGAGDEILWHSGSTPGFVSIVCLDKSRRMGVAVLNNRSGGGDNLGFHLLAGTPVRSERVEILLPISELERIAGRYQLTPKAVLQITIEDAQLYTQLIVEDAQRSRPILPIYPESATHFFWKARAGDISFQIDAGGGVNRLWLRQGQAAAERIV